MAHSVGRSSLPREFRIANWPFLFQAKQHWRFISRTSSMIDCEPEPLQQVERTLVRFRGRKLAYFGGCDYFRLASDARVKQAVRRGLEEHGLNTAASRMTTGNHVVYRELERSLARFFGAEDALVVPTGYQGSAVVAQALAGSFSHALLDKRAHASLSDAARFLDCPILRFETQSAAALDKAVRRCGPESKLMVLTDGLFSHDGSVAPLKEYLRVLPRDALLLVDDAHGAGVIGKTGKGTPEYAAVPRERVIQAITLSKAFGVYGGAVLCDKALRQQILKRSHMFAGSTPLPLPLVMAAMESIAILANHRELRKRLHENAAHVKDALEAARLKMPRTPGPIVRILPQSQAQATTLKRLLLRAGIHPPFILYPGGPENGYFRFVISSEHTQRQLDELVRVLTKFLGTKAHRGTVPL